MSGTFRLCYVHILHDKVEVVTGQTFAERSVLFGMNYSNYGSTQHIHTHTAQK